MPRLRVPFPAPGATKDCINQRCTHGRHPIYPQRIHGFLLSVPTRADDVVGRLGKIQLAFKRKLGTGFMNGLHKIIKSKRKKLRTKERKIE